MSLSEPSENDLDDFNRDSQVEIIDYSTQNLPLTQNEELGSSLLPKPQFPPHRITLPSQSPQRSGSKYRDVLRNYNSQLEITDNTLFKDILAYNHVYSSENDKIREKELLEAKRSAITQRRDLDKVRHDKHARRQLLRRNGILNQNDTNINSISSELSEQDNSFLEGLEYGSSNEKVDIDNFEISEESEDSREVVVIENELGCNPLPLSASYSNFTLKSRSKKWNREECKKLLFYIEKFGFDFDLISLEFGCRSAAEISKKFNQEFKKNPQQISAAFSRFMKSTSNGERYENSVQHLRDGADADVMELRKRRRAERETELANLRDIYANKSQENSAESEDDSEIDNLSISVLSTMNDQESEFTVPTREPSPEILENFENDFEDSESLDLY